MFDKFHITFASAATAAARGMLALPVAPSPASANICTDIITTTWSAPGDINITTNQTSFTACSTTSTLAGDGVVSIDPDPYSVTVSAIDNDTFQLIGSISDLFPTGVGDSPFITLVLSDIDWVGMSGSIDNVIFTGGAFGNFGLDSFTSDSITTSGSFFCGTGSSPCPFTNVTLGTYDLVVTHVPLPAALPLFLSALAGLGLMGWRRRTA